MSDTTPLTSDDQGGARRGAGAGASCTYPSVFTDDVTHRDSVLRTTACGTRNPVRPRRHRPPRMHARAQAQGLEDSATLAVDFNHLQAFDEELAGVVAREYYRVEPALRKARRAMHHAFWRSRCMQDPDM